MRGGDPVPDPVPTGPALEAGPADLPGLYRQAVRRIQELEGALARHRELVTATQADLQAIRTSTAWKLLVRSSRLRDRLFPADTRRRRVVTYLARSLVRFGLSLARPAGRVPYCSINDGYDRWIAANEPGPAELKRQRRTCFPGGPRVSILASLNDPPPRHLRTMLQSVQAQTYADWELCLAHGPVLRAEVRELLEACRRGEARVRLLALPAGLGLAGFQNAALAAATGDYIALLDQDDALAPFALFEVVRALQKTPEADFLYSDEDCLSRRGRRKHPHFKPDWSPETLRGHNYVGHLTVFRRDLVHRAGRFRPGFEGGWNYDLILRAGEKAHRIVHVPKVLYHRRKRKPRPAGDTRARKAVQSHLDRLGITAAVLPGPRLGTLQVRYPLPAEPLVSILIPNKDQPEMLARCVESVSRSSYTRHEIVIVENHSMRTETFACYERLTRRPNVRVLTWDQPFNYAAINNFAARSCGGDLLLFLNNDMEAINRDWLERLLEHALRPEVGVVGARLYYPDDTVQHAGVIVSNRYGPSHYQRFFARSSAGYADRLAVVQNLAAVTGACLMIRRPLFEAVGGFDECFPLTYNDIDLCLKARQRGHAVLWTPHAELYHYESATRGSTDTPEKQARDQYDMQIFRWKWGDFLGPEDAYYNPNLTVRGEDCSLRFNSSV